MSKRGRRSNDELEKQTTGAKRFDFFTEEQNDAFGALPDKVKGYVIGIASGMKKKDAYYNAGYNGSFGTQGARALEDRYPEIRELISVFRTQITASEFFNEDGKLAKQAMAKAEQRKAEQMIETVTNMSPQVASSVMLYKDIATGKLFTTKVTKTIDPQTKKILKETVEEFKDVRVRMEAQREMDKLLGLSTAVFRNEQHTQLNQFNINIVDTSIPKAERDDCSLLKNIGEEVEEITVEEEEKRARSSKSKQKDDNGIAPSPFISNKGE